MKRWIIYRDRATGQFCNERLFDGESHDQVEERVVEQAQGGVPAERTATFVRVLKDGAPVNKHEGELYDVFVTDESSTQRDMLKLLARLNGVARVMEG